MRFRNIEMENALMHNLEVEEQRSLAFYGTSTLTTGCVKGCEIFSCKLVLVPPHPFSYAQA